MELVRTTAIRRNPASPLIEYALRAWVESRASAASGGESALLSRKRPGLRLSTEAANRNGATVFGSEFAFYQKKEDIQTWMSSNRAPTGTQHSGPGGKAKKKS